MNSERGGERITLASANVSVSTGSPVPGSVPSVSMASVPSVSSTATIPGASSGVVLNRVITVRHTAQGTVRDVVNSGLHGHSSVVPENLTTTPHITLVDDDGDLDDDDDVEMEVLLLFKYN